MGNRKSICVLKSLLNGELSAVKNYKAVLERLRNSEIARELTELLSAHARRVRKLRRRLRQLGATAGGVEKVCEFVFPPIEATAITTDANALIFLGQGEDRGLAAYEECMDLVDAETSALIIDELFPEQEVTHSVVCALRDSLPLQIKSA